MGGDEVGDDIDLLAVWADDQAVEGSDVVGVGQHHVGARQDHRAGDLTAGGGDLGDDRDGLTTCFVIAQRVQGFSVGADRERSHVVEGHAVGAGDGGRGEAEGVVHGRRRPDADASRAS